MGESCNIIKVEFTIEGSPLGVLTVPVDVPSWPEETEGTGQELAPDVVAEEEPPAEEPPGTCEKTSL